MNSLYTNQTNTCLLGTTVHMAESIQKPVQQLVMNKTQQPPERYIVHVVGVLNTSVPEMDIPIIDLEALHNRCSKQIRILRSALTSWGTFQVSNHGLTNEFVDKVREVSKQFFALSADEKQSYLREDGSIEGYGNDMILSDKQTLDWTDRLYLTVYPQDRRNLKFWPNNPQSFREIVEEYTLKLKLINEVLLKAMAISLDLEEKCFLDQYGERGTMFLRFNLYPPCPRPDLTLGLKPHADGSAITILLQDEQVEGLQFLKNDHWFRTPIIPHALLINIGDQVEIMSNGVFKSPVHRVVTNSERERMSLAMFCVPDSENEIKPADGLTNETTPRLYKSINNYLGSYFEYYQKGRRPIEAAII